MTCHPLLVPILALAFAVAAFGQASEEGLRERYGLLLERNLFMKDRRPAPPPRDDRIEAAAPPPPIESLYVVIGLVEEGEAFRAHVEDRQSGELLRLKPGDALAEGRIESIDLDGVVYVAGDNRTRVAIGEDLRGQAAAAAALPNPGANGGSGDGNALNDPTEPSGPIDPANMSIEERMRLRRLQGGSQ